MSKTIKTRVFARYFDVSVKSDKDRNRRIDMARVGVKPCEQSCFDSPPFDFELVGSTPWGSKLMRRAGRIAKRHGLTFIPYSGDGRSV